MRLSPSSFQIVDRGGEDDPCGIGIAKSDDPGTLVYFSTVGLPPGHFFVELERPAPRGTTFSYHLAGTFDDLETDEFIEIVARHLQD